LAIHYLNTYIYHEIGMNFPKQGKFIPKNYAVHAQKRKFSLRP
jgi:hypothetical protein